MQRGESAPLGQLLGVAQVEGAGLLLAGDEGVIGADDFEVECRADPHGVGVDQFLGNVGSVVDAIVDCDNGGPLQIRRPPLQFCYQCAGGLVGKKLSGLVVPGPTRGFVKVIEAKAASGVLPDGGVG